jgi:hypothetical protein
LTVPVNNPLITHGRAIFCSLAVICEHTNPAANPAAATATGVAETADKNITAIPGVITVSGIATGITFGIKLAKRKEINKINTGRRVAFLSVSSFDRIQHNNPAFLKNLLIPETLSKIFANCWQNGHL